MSEEEYRKFIQSLPDDACDGHTQFYRFTPEEKLMWRSQIVQFVIEASAWRKARKEKSQSTASEKFNQN